MKLPRATTGLVFAAIYLVAYAAAYLDYRQHRGAWMADLWLAILAVPFTLVGRLLSGDSTFQFEAREPFSLLVAAFLLDVAYALGAGIAAGIDADAQALSRLVPRLRGGSRQRSSRCGVTANISPAISISYRAASSR